MSEAVRPSQFRDLDHLGVRGTKRGTWASRARTFLEYLICCAAPAFASPPAKHANGPIGPVCMFGWGTSLGSNLSFDKFAQRTWTPRQRRPAGVANRNKRFAINPSLLRSPHRPIGPFCIFGWGTSLGSNLTVTHRGVGAANPSGRQPRSCGRPSAIGVPALASTHTSRKRASTASKSP